MSKFSDILKQNNPGRTRISLTPTFDLKLENILNNLQIEILDQDDKWEGRASIIGIKEALEEIKCVVNNKINTNSHNLLMNCQESLYLGDLKAVKNKLLSFNESNEPEYWESEELYTDNESIKNLFKTAGVILKDIDFNDNKIEAFIDCEASGLSYSTIDQLQITVDKLKKLESKFESIGFIIKFNKNPFESGTITLTLER